MMKTVSLQLAKELKEAGYPQESSYWYIHIDNKFEIESQQWADYAYPSTFEEAEKYAATTADEILERLTNYIIIQRHKAKGLDINSQWYVNDDSEEEFHIESHQLTADSLAEAAGKMWLYLKQNKLLEGLNKETL